MPTKAAMTVPPLYIGHHYLHCTTNPEWYCPSPLSPVPYLRTSAPAAAITKFSPILWPFGKLLHSQHRFVTFSFFNVLFQDSLSCTMFGEPKFLWTPFCRVISMWHHLKPILCSLLIYYSHWWQTYHHPHICRLPGYGTTSHCLHYSLLTVFLFSIWCCYRAILLSHWLAWYIHLLAL